jgi:triphosphoribosyl-dephospho-CoA synthase
MDFTTFMRSLNALRDYFPGIAECGTAHPNFTPLRQLGIEAEARMLAATGGINTHRGAIFNLGLLCAAAGSVAMRDGTLSALAVCEHVSERWGTAVLANQPRVADDEAPSHGLVVARRYGTGGARQEAALGFPAALEVGLPAYRDALAVTGSSELAAVQALFALIAVLEDSNLLWRGGLDGLAHARSAAAAFLAAGGVLATDWRESAARIDRDFSQRRLSPGGSADLLGVTLFLADLEGFA